MILDRIINFNRIFDKTEIRNLISWFLANYGSIRTKNLLDKMKSFGLIYATTTGMSLGLEDLVIPTSKIATIKNADRILGLSNIRYQKARISLVEYLEKENEVWSIANENLKRESISNLKQVDFLNPLYSMTLSGARGSIAQVKQLIGMRGLMADTQGNLIRLPIKSNFREGLNIVEYFISCYGARKGLIDTALKTANSGYLTRRLIYAGQNSIIKKSDCFTRYNDTFTLTGSTKEEFKFLKEKLLGRIISKTIMDEKTGKVLVSSGQDICNVWFEL